MEAEGSEKDTDDMTHGGVSLRGRRRMGQIAGRRTRSSRKRRGGSHNMWATQDVACCGGVNSNEAMEHDVNTCRGAWCEYMQGNMTLNMCKTA